MKSPRVLLLLAIAGVAGGVLVGVLLKTQPWLDTYTVDRDEVRPAQVSDLLPDDRLEDKKPAFDPALIDSRPFGPDGNRWQLNLSAAVLGLDVPDIRDDRDAGALKLHPSFAAAAAANPGRTILPSVNLVSAKAKQFDDGLYAALDLYMAQNHEEGIRSVERLARQLLASLPPGGDAAAWLWAALTVGGYVSPDEATRVPPATSRHVSDFDAIPESVVVGFYEWSPELERVFRFLRFLQQPIADTARAEALRRAIQGDPGCVEMYQRMLAFYARLTNPLRGPNLLDAPGGPPRFLPYSVTPETDLFGRLYPMGMPGGADLMRDFITAVRDGRVDLTPRENSGWYDRQMHALEALVLPERGAESGKLLLTRKYKLRLIEAFKAMVTRHRETHIRQAEMKVASAALPPDGEFKPRLRLEPNPTYYLRIARGYAFLQQAVLSMVEDPNALRGARAGGWRESPLGDELESMRQLFYGLYLVSCEDIGLRPELNDGEVENADYARAHATDWLKNWATDPDLAVDTRVAVPLYDNLGSARFWGTVGVRLAPLRAAWRTAPSWRPWPEGEAAEWQAVDAWKLSALDCWIPVDEFLEFDRPTIALSRADFRRFCDRGGDKPGIAAALAATK